MMRLSAVRGFGPILIDRVKKRWPLLLDDAELRSNPYQLCDIDGVGFLSADRVAQEVFEIRPDSPLRTQAAIDHVLQQGEQQGHTGLPRHKLLADTSRLLACEVDDDLLIPDDRKVVWCDGMLSRRRMLEAERSLARKLSTMMSASPGAPLAYRTDGLAQDQIRALELMQGERVFVLTGCPGTGKTHLVKSLVEHNDCSKIALCAPTGKAARRLTELTGRPASTVHRLLDSRPREVPGHGLRFSFGYNHGNRLPHRLVVVDEISMMDLRLASSLVEALHDDASLLLVGDAFQLPSVGPGAVLQDLLKARVPNFELTILKRQKTGQLIARTCHSIRHHKKIIVEDDSADFFFVNCADADEVKQQTIEFATRRIPAKFGLDPSREVVTLTMFRTRGVLSVESLNATLRSELNPSARGDGFAPGDRVIQTRNDYTLGIMNGELGVVECRTPDSLLVSFDAPARVVEIPKGEQKLMLAWALTTHKGQGSEWRGVVVPLHNEQGFMANAHLIYTAISRARDVCVVIGPRSFLDWKVRDHSESQRHTRLVGMLEAGTC